MLTDDGFCTRCRRWVHEHPQLRCPFCNVPKAARVFEELAIDRDAAPEEVMAACEEALTHHRRTLAELLELRRQSAIRALAAYGPLEAVRRTRHRLGTLERIIAGAERGERGERAVRPDRRKPAPTKERKARAAAWNEYEARLRRRERSLAELPESERQAIAARLREPLRPPGAI